MNHHLILSPAPRNCSPAQSGLAIPCSTRRFCSLPCCSPPRSCCRFSPCLTHTHQSLQRRAAGDDHAISGAMTEFLPAMVKALPLRLLIAAATGDWPNVHGHLSNTHSPRRLIGLVSLKCQADRELHAPRTIIRAGVSEVHIRFDWLVVIAGLIIKRIINIGPKFQSHTIA